jgi:hypothetical protein
MMDHQHFCIASDVLISFTSMKGSFSKFLVAENPPWLAEPTAVAPASMKAYASTSCDLLSWEECTLSQYSGRRSNTFTKIEGSVSDFALMDTTSEFLEPVDAADCGTLQAYVTASFDWSLTDALRTKLNSLYGTRNSAELDRQLLLALHDDCHAQILWFEGAQEQPQLFDAYGQPLPTKPRSSDILVGYNDILPRLSDFLPSTYSFEFTQILLLHFFSSLIDRLADYWTAFAQARLAWLRLLVAFLQQLKRSLSFKPLHTPVRLFRSSIHPVELPA